MEKTQLNILTTKDVFNKFNEYQRNKELEMGVKLTKSIVLSLLIDEVTTQE